MTVTFDRSFSKWLDKLADKNIKAQVAKFIIRVKEANSIEELPAIKKLKGGGDFYRKRMGDYRLGFESDGKNVHFIIIAHRKDIYRLFP